MKTLSEHPGLIGRLMRAHARQAAKRQARRERRERLAFLWRHSWLVREARALAADLRTVRRFVAGFWRF